MLPTRFAMGRALEVVRDLGKAECCYLNAAHAQSVNVEEAELLNVLNLNLEVRNNAII